MTVDETTHGILNQLPGIEDIRYLELGVGNNENFTEIRCRDKTSVDMNKKATWQGKTDDYFAQLAPAEKFNIIFIDACHDYDFVLRDFNNSVKHATDWIIMHDMIPPTAEWTKSSRCSDCYKLLPVLMRSGMQVFPLNERLGLTFIKMPGKAIVPTTADKSLKHKDFMEIMQETRLYSIEEIVSIMKNV